MPQVIQHMLPSWAPPELVKRISVTFLMLLLARIGHYIALPCLDLGVLAAATAGDGSVPQSLTSSLTGTASELGGNIYLLSITPYMTAGLTLAALQLIPEIKRHIELLREEGRSGRETINHYTNTLFVGAALVQAITNASQLSFAARSAGKFFKIQSIVTLMAGAVLCKFAVQNIDQHGLGDGTGIVIGAGIALRDSFSFLLLLSFIIPGADTG
jgi:preprotein translocase subunit SecY